MKIKMGGLLDKIFHYHASGFININFSDNPRIIIQIPEYAPLPDESLHNLITFPANVYLIKS